MKNKKSIFFLYSEIGPYNIPVFEELVNSFKFDIHVVHWDQNCLKPYIPKEISNVTYYKRSTFNRSSLKLLLDTINPDIVYISGWMDKLYLNCVLPLRKKNIPVVSGFDDIWLGNIRQILGKYFFKLVLKKYFSHAWVAGEAQFEFVKNLGFDSKNIIFDLLSADVSNFKSTKYNPKCNSFLYVGNFRLVKGTDILISAFDYYKTKLDGSFNLVCIGNGQLEQHIKSQCNITVHDYMDQKKLLLIAQQCSAFVLPSRHDQWGVVVHEFASAGLPLILSTGVGSSSKFLINGFNGFLFENGSIVDLANKMKDFEMLTCNERLSMSNNSFELGKRISPKSCAANLVSVLR